MIEAEVKARVRNLPLVRERLERLGPGRDEVYEDTYYDDEARTLSRGDRELRVRTVRGPGGAVSVLTYKGARVDPASGSKPEHETRVADASAVRALLGGLGYRPWIRFEKRCRNHGFSYAGRDILATVVRVPELGETFVEVETMVDGDALPAALDAIRAVLRDLGIHEDDHTNESYTDAVIARRALGRSPSEAPTDSS
ncbi:class IV adenylate cyclase [Embleya sp. NBC_00896]|uniref:class IV adenylate cyclase n=1 Tax=Embleya sp. NBC_00896 TaxID=2975961 RepID=UPI003867A832|nr:class IV adenylate cyclase [Embleya sp. NBC_00896]